MNGFDVQLDPRFQQQFLRFLKRAQGRREQTDVSTERRRAMLENPQDHQSGIASG